MGTRLHVGNLPYSATEEEITELFGEVGTVVSVELPKDKYSGRPRGFGFVEMESDAEADEAIKKFEGYSLDGRSLRVDMAKEREERAGGYGPSYGKGPSGGKRQEGRGRGQAA